MGIVLSLLEFLLGNPFEDYEKPYKLGKKTVYRTANHHHKKK